MPRRPKGLIQRKPIDLNLARLLSTRCLGEKIKAGCYELGRRGLLKVSQQPIPVAYEYVRIDTGFKPHLVVEDKVIIEIKSIELIAPVHKKQLLTYLRLGDKRLGLLINFHVALIKEGIARIVNSL